MGKGKKKIREREQKKKAQTSTNPQQQHDDETEKNSHNHNTKRKKGKQQKKSGNSTSSDSDDSDAAFRHNVVAGSDGMRQIIDMAADGNCLFRSISDQLYRDFGQKHDLVRKEICDFLHENKEDFAIFLLMDDEEEDVMNFDEYVEEMREEGTWGGDVEIVCAARLYRCSIIVYSASGAYNIGMGEDDGSTEASKPNNMFLSFHENSHYNSVRDERIEKPRKLTPIPKDKTQHAEKSDKGTKQNKRSTRKQKTRKDKKAQVSNDREDAVNEASAEINSDIAKGFTILNI